MKEDIFAYRRQRVLNYQKMFKKFTENLIEAYNGKPLVLFGSRGRGDNRESSDLDVLVVLRERMNRDYQRIYH